METLDTNSRILEIGAGIGLFSLLLSSSGASVVSYEPETAGFNQMDDLSDVVARAWVGPAPKIERLRSKFPSERVEAVPFDMAIALNVIEHVPDPGVIVAEATRLLGAGKSGYFVCPNYAFPYEPHFGFPTLINKRVTELVFHKKIASSAIRDAEQFWAELSWPTVASIRKTLRCEAISHRFSDAVLEAYIRRLDDPVFVEREGLVFSYMARFVRRPAELFVQALPARISPIIFLTTTGSSRSVNLWQNVGISKAKTLFKSAKQYPQLSQILRIINSSKKYFVQQLIIYGFGTREPGGIGLCACQYRWKCSLLPL